MPVKAQKSSELGRGGLQKSKPSFLDDIGLFGLGTIEPIILAALVTEEPLLLIGPHGTGKSLLLTNIAQALGLDFRHYNASLLNFDDLVGFPVPGKDGCLEYIKSPASIWGAQAVIFDEISRCRLDLQNKLFPIIHEARAQGLALEGLRYRWGAMNPPVTDDGEDGYIGSEPLDSALADRFAFIVNMPSWGAYTEADQLSIILAKTQPRSAQASNNLAAAIASSRAALPSIMGSIGQGLALYVRSLIALLGQAGLPLSPRRAGMLHRNIVAVHAAMVSLAPDTKPSESALLALRNSIPQIAEGLKVSETKVLAAHREAWKLAGVKSGDPLRAILTTADPIQRVALAVGAKKIAKGEFSTIISDAIAQLCPGAREAVAVHLFETGAAGRLNAAIAEQAGEIYADVAKPLKFSESLHASNSRFKTWNQIKNILSKLDPTKPRSHLAANALAACFAKKQLDSPEDAEKAFADWAAADAILSGVEA